MRSIKFLVRGLILALVLGAGSFLNQAAFAAQDTITITASDFAFAGPTEVTAGWVTFVLENAGQAPHQAQIAKFKAGESVESFLAALQQGEAAALPLIEFYGGPAVIDPTGKTQATVKLDPGSYAFLCFVPNSEGVPHLALGMIKGFTVVEGNVGTEPKADGQVTLEDFAITLPQTIPSGPVTLQVTNQGPQPHELALLKLADGKTQEDVFAWFQTPQGPPPFTDYGGFQAIDQGKTGYAMIDFTPGNYLALCNVPDPASGKAHVELGMLTAFTVDGTAPLPTTGGAFDAANGLWLVIAALGAALVVVGVLLARRTFSRTFVK